jgi:hypothetical protein
VRVSGTAVALVTGANIDQGRLIDAVAAAEDR